MGGVGNKKGVEKRLALALSPPVASQISLLSLVACNASKLALANLARLLAISPIKPACGLMRNYSFKHYQS